VPVCRRSFFTLVSLVSIITGATSAFSGDAAWAGIRSRQAFVSDTNQARVNHDRRVYQVSSGLTQVAQQWAEWMARHHRLEHNPNLETQVHNWQDIGENIGDGQAESPIHRAFMHDQYHRDNILSPDYTQVGIGTARDSSGRLYVDEVFRRPS